MSEVKVSGTSLNLTGRCSRGHHEPEQANAALPKRKAAMMNHLYDVGAAQKPQKHPRTVYGGPFHKTSSSRRIKPSW